MRSSNKTDFSKHIFSSAETGAHNLVFDWSFTLRFVRVVFEQNRWVKTTTKMSKNCFFWRSWFFLEKNQNERGSFLSKKSPPRSIFFFDRTLISLISRYEMVVFGKNGKSFKIDQTVQTMAFFEPTFCSLLKLGRSVLYRRDSCCLFFPKKL